MDPRLAIYLLCISGGFILLIGGLLLVWKKKILVDAQTGAVVDVEVPVLGKLKTNVPGLFFFLLGVGLVAYPTYQVDKLSPNFPVYGKANAGTGQMEVYIALKPEVMKMEKRDFSIRAPYSALLDGYEVLYISQNRVVSLKSVRMPSPGHVAEIGDEVTLEEGKKLETADKLGIQ